MTADRVQHHVATALSQSMRVHRASTAHRYTCVRFSSTQWKRRQSTATTTTTNTSIAEDAQTLTSRNEIPLNCYVESATYPEPSLKRNRTRPSVDLNTTRPAILESPAALERRDYPDGQIPLGDRAKYLYRLGKSFLTFYKTGLKNVWHNSKRYRALRTQLQGNTLNNAAKFGGQTTDKKSIPEISRSEYQLALRTRHDLFKMLPFSLVFLICGEFTPLVIIALGSSVVPYTCRIPRQLEKDLENRIRQDIQYMEELPRLHPAIETPLETTNWRMEHLDAFRLGLTSTRTPLPLLGPLYHTLITRPRLIRHCDTILSDTLLIHREGGPSGLSHLELYEWAESYGLYTWRKYVEECRRTGQDPKSEKSRTALLAAIDDEVRYMRGLATEFSRLKPSEQWRIGLRTVGSNSPDWKSRMRDVRKEWKQA